MICINKWIGTGRLTSTPVLRYTNSNKPYCHFSIAVPGRQNIVYFINCESWDKLAENLCKYQEKGNKILVEGRIQVSSYEVNGENRTSTNIVCSNIEFLQTKNTQKNESAAQNTDLHKRDDNDIIDPFADFGEQIAIDDDLLD